MTIKRVVIIAPHKETHTAMNSYEIIEFVLSLSIGTVLPLCAAAIADMLTKRPQESMLPKEMLGCFLKNQTLKLLLFSILCLCSLVILPSQGHLVIIGVAVSTLSTRLLQKANLNEQRTKYSN